MTDYTVRFVDKVRAARLIKLVGATHTDAAHFEAKRRAFREYLAGVPVVVADYIDEFRHYSKMERIERTHKDEWILDPRDVPNLIPPFESFWLEWRMFDPRAHERGLHYVGALIDTQADDPTGRGRHLIAATVFALIHSEVHHFAWVPVAYSDASGNLTGGVTFEKSEFIRDMIDQPERREHHQMWPKNIFADALLALSFMNCRNVSLIDGPEPPPRLNKAHHGRTGQWLSKHRIIDITPMSRIIKDAAATSGDGSIKQALHIMRGHFKTYKDNGLFGKLKGTYWWGQTARGSLAHGEVKASYNINLKGKRQV